MGRVKADVLIGIVISDAIPKASLEWRGVFRKQGTDDAQHVGFENVWPPQDNLARYSIEYFIWAR